MYPIYVYHGDPQTVFSHGAHLQGIKLFLPQISHLALEMHGRDGGCVSSSDFNVVIPKVRCWDHFQESREIRS